MVRSFEGADWTPIPDYLRNSLKLYVRHGRIPGRLLTAVLMDDLVACTDCATAKQWEQVPAIVNFMSMYLPPECWGSPERLALWESVGGLNGLEELATGVEQPE